MENESSKKSDQGKSQEDKDAMLDLDLMTGLVERIRTHGSLLLSAGLAFEHEDWTAVLHGGRMIMEDAQLVLDQFDLVSGGAS